MNKLKIALCKTAFLGPVSGSDELLVNYAINLRREGHEVDVVLLYAPTVNDQYLRRLQVAGVNVTAIITHSVLFKFLRVVRHLLSSALFFLFLLKRAPEGLRRIWQVALNMISQLHYRHCRAFLAKNKHDVLHVFTPDIGATLIIRAGHQLGIPVLYHELGTPHHLPLLTPYYKRLEKVLPLCTEFAALSPRLAVDWSIRFPFLKSISVLPLIVERSKTLMLNRPPQNGEPEIVFGFAARIEEGKGPLLLIDALAQVKREQAQAIALIAGSGPQLPEAKARVLELDLSDACEFVGQYTEPLGRTAFMSSLDVFVLPSLAEGTPNSVVEAMAHGVPVIASAVGGIPDMLDSETGIIVPPGDASALVEAMLALARDPQRRNQMGAAARERYRELFSPAVVMPLMVKTYRRVTGNGHISPDSVAGDKHFHPWADSKHYVRSKRASA